MNNQVRRIFVEKKQRFNIESQGLYEDLKYNLGINELENVRIIVCYDVAGISKEDYEQAKYTIFSEPPVDHIYEENMVFKKNERIFAIEYLPGQYDQRADSAAQCIQILTQGEKPQVSVAKIIVLEGNVSEQQFNMIKDYCINPVEAQEASMDKPETLDVEFYVPEDVKTISGFIGFEDKELQGMLENMGLAMDMDDLKFCQQYFKNTEKRDPSVTEIRMIDTYWSDHCRHTTFQTNIENIEFEKAPITEKIESVYESYLKARKFVYQERKKDVTLMDLATIGMKELKKIGKLDDLDESDEINACSIIATVDIDGKDEEWLVMFKNETHNHPTEIEPFGGAATCLGGAIRDPLSGRSYVYQAMRVTGSGDPRTKVEDTIEGKLPQRKITTGAAEGYSSYGNQIGLATGHVTEIYDEGYVAKRMEIGAVVGAAPRSHVKREEPMAGDVVILLGGKTGRDGCGGATGSSKAHTEKSLETCGAEVQKGNPPEERKIQRLFRKAEVTQMIKRCNDFGAGGVSVAIGELADGLKINLDVVPKKYEGLDGTELAISESQERMAVVVSKEDAQRFIQAATEENLEATIVAVVTKEARLQMTWREKIIVDINRKFLNSNGAPKNTDIVVESPRKEENYFNKMASKDEQSFSNIKEVWMNHLQDLNVCSQKGLVERFDSTIGAGTVFMPFGGEYQLTPTEAMVAKIPLLEGETQTGTVMSYGYNPNIAKWSPFHGAVYAVVEAVAKIVAVGGEYKNIRLTLQEYFERLGNDPAKWGKPFSALLGAYYAQKKLGIPAIGGKDSMSGSFNDLHVPPTLVAFAVDIVKVNKVISPEFKKTNSVGVLIELPRDEYDLPDFGQLKMNYECIHQLIQEDKLLAAHTVREGGIAETICKMCFGNKIGFKFSNKAATTDSNTNAGNITHTDDSISAFFTPSYGSIVLEMNNCNNHKGTDAGEINLEEVFKGIEFKELGTTIEEQSIIINEEKLDLNNLIKYWEEPLEDVFPTKVKGEFIRKLALGEQ
ncbi:MAG: phosphoribosylformylglycinamidine synthase, partial [Eubacteriales bacterium]|nr:phosphoribosylformylglycinamidine synthase [Eubacteriales bacterium]